MDHLKAGLAGAAASFVVMGLFIVGLGMWGATQEPPRPQASLAASPNLSAPELDFGAQFAAQSCNGTGAPVVDVSEKIRNDADTGAAGNYWGLDTSGRTIEMWKTADGDYCALVRYGGSFTAFAGQRSPGGTGTLTGSETGSVEGGYKIIITGTPLADPAWKTSGDIGTVDYQCDAQGHCPGSVNWLDRYFSPGYTFEQPWWVWIYRANGGKTWINAITGNQGDII